MPRQELLGEWSPLGLRPLRCRRCTSGRSALTVKGLLTRDGQRQPPNQSDQKCFSGRHNMVPPCIVLLQMHNIANQVQESLPLTARPRPNVVRLVLSCGSMLTRDLADQARASARCSSDFCSRHTPGWGSPIGKGQRKGRAAGEGSNQQQA
jgi:hypothetical protein